MLKNLQKISKKSMPIWSRKIKGENRIKIGFGRVLGSILEGLGRSRASLGRSWAPLGHLGGVQNRTFFFNIGPRWSPRGLRVFSLLGASWALLGRFLGRFFPAGAVSLIGPPR